MNNPQYCGKCNEGYYLGENDKTKCTQCSVINCKACPNNHCLHCLNDNTEINYPDLTEYEALSITLEIMDLVKHYSKHIYCKSLNNKPSLYYIWNNYKRKMIEICGDECNDRKIRELKPQFIMTNEYLEAVNLNFEFTYQDNIYEKNNKIY